MSRDKRLQDRSIYPHWCTDTVRFCDQDAAGHVNNVALCAYLETARLTFMRDMGMMEKREDGVRGISAGMTVSFLAKIALAGPGRTRHRRHQGRHQFARRGIGGLQGRCLHCRGRDDGGPPQGHGSPSDRSRLPGNSGKVSSEGLLGPLTQLRMPLIFLLQVSRNCQAKGR